MILPTKHVSLDRSLIGAGAIILPLLNQPRTTTGLWEEVKKAPQVGSYGRFILILDFLFAINAIDITDGLLVRTSKP